MGTMLQKKVQCQPKTDEFLYFYSFDHLPSRLSFDIMETHGTLNNLNTSSLSLDDLAEFEKWPFIQVKNIYGTIQVRLLCMYCNRMAFEMRMFLLPKQFGHNYYKKWNDHFYCCNEHLEPRIIPDHYIFGKYIVSLLWRKDCVIAYPRKEISGRYKFVVTKITGGTRMKTVAKYLKTHFLPAAVGIFEDKEPIYLEPECNLVLNKSSLFFLGISNTFPILSVAGTRSFFRGCFSTEDLLCSSHNYESCFSNPSGHYAEIETMYSAAELFIELLENVHPVEYFANCQKIMNYMECNFDWKFGHAESSKPCSMRLIQRHLQ